MIATDIQSEIRPDPNAPARAGWGQFTGVAHAHQIGPYGTCAGLLTMSVGALPPDNRAVAQMEHYWSSGSGGKLYRQNVRLAFLVLALSKIQDASSKRLCDAAANELRTRQLQDGSWGDWWDDGGNPPPGRSETTAWVVLALGRANPTDAAAIKGAKCLADQATASGPFEILSPIAVAAATSVLPRNQQPDSLRKRAHYLVQNIQMDRAENISFFDYINPACGSRLARDYLCFPAFYPLSLLINALLRESHFLKVPRLAAARMRGIERLAAMIGSGGLYRLPGARFPATVDQAFVALSYEQLAQNPPSIDPWVARLRPILSWARNSYLTRVVAPLLIITFAIVTLESPAAVPEAMQSISGASLERIITSIKENESIVRLLVAIVLAVFPQIPSSVWTFIKGKLGL